MYIITARRITSGELLKYRKGFCIAGDYGTPLPGSSRFTLTKPSNRLLGPPPRAAVTTSLSIENCSRLDLDKPLFFEQPRDKHKSTRRFGAHPSRSMQASIARLECHCIGLRSFYATAWHPVRVARRIDSERPASPDMVTLYRSQI